ncbi:MAG: hypothetical protein AAGD43_18250 [Pseudomonadota bacterium]
MPSTSILSKLLIIPPVILGGAALWYTVAMREPPQQLPPVEQTVAVRVLTLDKTDVSPRLVGYGSVRPENVWSGVVQVSGRVDSVNPRFRRGATLEAGTELIRINSDDYKLAIAEAEAQIRSAEASLEELKVSETNTRELLKIEQESEALKQRSVDAKRALLKRGNLAQLSFDAELRDLLTQKKLVQDLRNSLRLMPTKIAVQQEQIRVNKSKLATAKLDLERTVVTLPFNARIASLDVEVSQFVQAGTKIGTADGIATAEITAQYPLAHIREFFDRLRDEFDPGERKWKKRQEFARAIGLYALVRLRTGDRDVTWRGRVARLNDTLDEQTRSIGLIILVDKPYAYAEPGERPPLVKGMFVEVELRTKSLKGKILVPSASIDDDHIYVVNDKSRLQKRKIKIGYRGDGFVVVDQGLKAGDRIVVSELLMATPNLLLKPTEDGELKERLKTLSNPKEARQ